MKTTFLAAISFFFVLAVTSCSNSLDEDNPKPGNGTNVLVVKLPENVKLTRAVETPVDGNTVTGVEDVTVFLLTGQLVERAVELEQDDIDAGYKRFEQIPSQVDRVIVVANRAGETIKNLVNRTQISNYAYSVASQHTKTELNGRTLMGEALVVDAVDPNPDTHLYKQAKVSLDAITARIEVGTVIPGEGVESVKLVAVYVNNFYGNYPMANLGTYPETDPNWDLTVTGNNPGANIGSKDPIGTITPASYTPAEYMTPGSDEVKQATDSKVYAFHVFPGNVPHVIMLVKVELKENYYEVDESGNALKYKYGFLTFTKFKTGTGGYIPSMTGHNIYKMGVGNQGIPVNAKDITDKPEKGAYDLEIYIDIRPWEVNEVTPEV